MSSVAKSTTVVAGEASESDDDTVATPTCVSYTEGRVPDFQQLSGDMQSSLSASGLGMVVPGEASESDDDEQLNLPAHYKPADAVAFSDDQPAGSPTTESDFALPAYDSLLHRKLRESNTSMRNNLNEFISKQFDCATKTLQSVGQQMANSQLLIQDVSHTMRLLTNDLFQLEDKVDIVVTCPILPHVTVVPQ